jgi:hypothetical protein
MERVMGVSSHSESRGKDESPFRGHASLVTTTLVVMTY